MEAPQSAAAPVPAVESRTAASSRLASVGGLAADVIPVMDGPALLVGMRQRPDAGRHAGHRPRDDGESHQARGHHPTLPTRPPRPGRSRRHGGGGGGRLAHHPPPSLPISPIPSSPLAECRYSEWGAWLDCSNDCGVGSQGRYRKFEGASAVSPKPTAPPDSAKGGKEGVGGRATVLGAERQPLLHDLPRLPRPRPGCLRRPPSAAAGRQGNADASLSPNAGAMLQSKSGPMQPIKSNCSSSGKVGLLIRMATYKRNELQKKPEQGRSTRDVAHFHQLYLPICLEAIVIVCRASHCSRRVRKT